MKMRPSILLALPCLLPTSFTLAQERDIKEVEAPPVEVSTFRVPTLVTEAAQGVTVLSNQEIQARKPANTGELLQMIPGLQVGNQGGAGGYSIIHIRGSDPEHTLVLVDGVRMNDPLLSRGGAYDLSAIDPSTIERVEVIRGTGSALYGADAIGGIVNIITRKPLKDGVSVSGGAGVGTKGYRNGNARLTGAAQNLSYGFGVARLEDGREKDGGDLDLTTFDGNLGLKIDNVADINLFARHAKRESSAFPDISGGIRLASLRTLEQRDGTEQTLGAGAIFGGGQSWKVNLQANRYEREENIVSPGVAPGPGAQFGVPAATTDTDLTRETLLASGSLKLPLTSDLTLGWEHESLDGAFRSVQLGDFAVKRTTKSLFGAIKSKPIENLTLLLDFRYDRVGGLSSETSPSAAIRYEFSPSGPAFKARYSEGFRPPSFFALASPLAGNPNLAAETSKSAEVGVEHWFGNATQVGLNLFRTRTRNLIDFSSNVPGPLGFGGFVNQDTVITKGYELIASTRPVAQLHIAANYTYILSDIVDSTEMLNNRPKQRASLLVGYDLDESSSVSWNTLYVSRSLDLSAPTDEIFVGSYARTDISYSYRWKWLQLSAAVDNLFDRKYEEFIGFTNPGRRYRLSLSARF